MGIYDRDYYHREGPSFLGSFAGSGRVCKWLIGINVAVFLGQVLSFKNTAIMSWLWLSPNDVVHGCVWQLVTYAFLHDPHSLWHILFNMLFLWWFGRDLEDRFGSREFLAFYLVAAILGGVAFTIWGLSTHPAAVCVGASGAVTAVLVVAALINPGRVIYLWFVLPIPIWIFVVFQVAQDAFIFASGMRTGTAVTVHLAGALFGFLYFKNHWHLLGMWDSLRSAARRRSRHQLRLYREDNTVSVGARSGQALDEHMEAKVDAVLDKVSKLGKDSLTDQELQILQQASEAYRKRRL